MRGRPDGVIAAASAQNRVKAMFGMSVRCCVYER
jgi:hypothetical protein